MKDAAAARGLVLLGVAPLAEEPDFPRYLAWIAEKRHAGMAYMEEHLEVRRDPRRLLAGARSVVVVGLPYYLGDKARPRGADEAPRVAQYARLRDYHRVLRKKAEGMLDDVLRGAESSAAAAANGPAVGRVLVDTAPLLERATAARAGGGFIGKNTCLIHPEEGSWLLLAELVTSLALPATEAAAVDPARRTEAGGCGSCRRCQVHCPTGALDRDYVMDAGKCLSYWTIEHRGTVPREYWPWFAHYWYGCDICQLVCPYNRGAAVQRDPELLRSTPLPSLFEVATMDQADYERWFGGSPMTRAKRHGLMRNALIAMAVTRDPRLEEALRLAPARCAEPVVAATVGEIRDAAGQF